MSVPVSERKKSRYQFYMNAIDLRKKIIALLLRDFGVKNRIRDIKFYGIHMEQEDKESFNNILEKYRINNVPAEYPRWIINKFRDKVWDLLETMVHSITCAYTIWPTSKAEFDEKRIWQDRAISACECLLQEFTLIIDILPIDANKYIKYVDSITEEEKLLKAWRKSCNKLNKF